MAEPLAGIAGTLAAGLFTVVTLVLVIPTHGQAVPETPETREDTASRRCCLYLLIPSLTGILLSSLLLSLVGGEVYYERASIMAVPAGALLGVSGIGTFGAIAWALKAYVRDISKSAVRFGNWAARGIWFAALIQVSFTIVNSGHHLRNLFRRPITGG